MGWKREEVERWRGGAGSAIHKAVRVVEWNLLYRRSDTDNFRQVMGNMQIIFNYIYFCFS